MADALASRSAVHAVVPESDRPTEPDMPAVRPREDTAPSLMRVFMTMLMRGRVTPAHLGLFGLLVGSGSIGGSWLFGPGGLTDDSAVRADQAAMREDIAAMRTSQTAMRDDLASMRTSLESCEADIALLDDGQVELLENASDTQAKHAKAITTIALKLGIAETIDVSPPRQRARRVRR